jgi:hypothetical protein
MEEQGLLLPSAGTVLRERAVQQVAERAQVHLQLGLEQAAVLAYLD